MTDLTRQLTFIQPTPTGDRVRIFPNTENCLRFVRALAVETNENWVEASCDINVDDRREHEKLDPI